jgi:hypothetical protein
MAKLFMTVDSDDELTQKVKKVDDEILLSSDVVLNESKKEIQTGSKQMWKFSEAVVVDKRAEDDEATAADERPPYKIPIEERV